MKTAKKEGLIKLNEKGRLSLYNIGGSIPSSKDGESVLVLLQRMNGPSKIVCLLRYDNKEQQAYQSNLESKPEIYLALAESEEDKEIYWNNYNAERTEKETNPRNNPLRGNDKQQAWKDGKRSPALSQNFDIVLPPCPRNFGAPQNNPLSNQQYPSNGPSLGGVARRQVEELSKRNNNLPGPREGLSPNANKENKPAKPCSILLNQDVWQGGEVQMDVDLPQISSPQTNQEGPLKEEAPKWTHLTKADFDVLKESGNQGNASAENQAKNGKMEFTTLLHQQHNQDSIFCQVMTGTTVMLPLGQFLAVCPNLEKKVSNETWLC